MPLDLHDDVQKVIRTAKDYLPIDNRGVRSLQIDATVRHFLPRIKSMRDGKGETYGAVVIIQDISELRFLDEMKSNLIATVSHELKTPAVSIRLSLSMLKEETFGPLSEQQQMLVDTSQREIERLIRNLATLLDVTCFEEGRAKLEYSVVTPQELADTIVEETRRAAQEAHVSVSVSQSQQFSELKLDRDRIIIAVTNLVLNAIKYSPPHATVDANFRGQSDRFIIAIKDTGPGIPVEHRSRVFERFFRVPGQKGKSGTGLGLSIVKSFVDAHYGSIEISGNQPSGAVFTLSIPVQAPTPRHRRER